MLHKARQRSCHDGAISIDTGVKGPINLWIDDDCFAAFLSDQTRPISLLSHLPLQRNQSGFFFFFSFIFNQSAISRPTLDSKHLPDYTSLTIGA